MAAKQIHTARCSCGGVAFEATGAPILSADCYCDSCQEGARRIEALPGAPKVLSADGGTGYVLYRNDRVRCAKGVALLKNHKLTPGSPTNRVIATCCNTAMVVGFDDSKHWFSMYRARFAGDAPPPALRVCTKFKPAGTVLANDIPNHAGYPPGFILKLVAARIAMLFGG